MSSTISSTLVVYVMELLRQFEPLDTFCFGVIRKTTSSLHMSKCPNTFNLYTLNVLMSKNWFCFFFLTFQHLLKFHVIGINSSLIFFKVYFVFQVSYTKPKVWQWFYRLQKNLSWLDLKSKQYAWQKSCSQ